MGAHSKKLVWYNGIHWKLCKLASMLEVSEKTALSIANARKDRKPSKGPFPSKEEAQSYISDNGIKIAGGEVVVFDYDFKDVADMAKKHGLSNTMVRHRMSKGSTLEEAVLPRREWQLSRRHYVVTKRDGKKVNCCTIKEVAMACGCTLCSARYAINKKNKKLKGHGLTILKDLK